MSLICYDKNVLQRDNKFVSSQTVCNHRNKKTYLERTLSVSSEVYLACLISHVTAYVMNIVNDFTYEFTFSTRYMIQA